MTVLLTIGIILWVIAVIALVIGLIALSNAPYNGEGAELTVCVSFCAVALPFVCILIYKFVMFAYHLAQKILEAS